MCTTPSEPGQAEPIRLGLVGLGWGDRVASAAHGLPGARLTACVARTRETSEAFAARHGLRACTNYEAMLADTSLHGVVIMTPNGTHRDLAVAALRAGKHVLVTKPIATTLEDAAAMIRTARETGRVLAVGHQSRRHPALRRLKQAVDAGELGRPHLIEGNTSSPTGLTLAAGHWRGRPEECPGGPLLQLGIHYVDNFQHFLGPIRTVSAWMGRTGAGGVDPDTTVTLLEFRSGVAGYLGSSYVTALARWIRVAGENGTACFQADGSLVLQQAAAAETLLPPVVDREAVLQGMLVEEIAEFAECIRTGAEPEIGGGPAARNLAVVLAAVESHLRGAPVDVDELLATAGISA